MLTKDLFSWFSKASTAHSSTWHATTATVESQQPTGPKPPSADPFIAVQPKATENTMKLRGGGAGEICCGVCTGLLCFECCEDCC